ncbi:hypothetical protein ACLKA6_016968 [Drosophila palustris]
MEASKQQNKSRIELFDNEERVKLIEEVQQILWDLTDKKQKSKARYKRRRRKEVQVKEFSGGLNDWESESSTKIEAAGGHLRVAGANSGAAGAKFYPEGGKS